MNPPASPTGETQRLAGIAKGWSSKTGVNSRFVTFAYRTLQPHFRGRTCLELGSADGQMTQYLVRDFARVVAFDGSRKFVDELATWKIPALEPVCALFEDLRLTERFDTIVCAHVLEHVADPVGVLQVARTLVAPGGVILLDVPHADSLHRQAAVRMGLLQATTDLNATDHQLGHRRVYTWATFHADIAAAGLRIVQQGGSFLKTVSNAQMEQWYTDAMLEAFYELGKEHPGTAAEIWAACEPA
jgi:2-polyprenyl-3-methyl-5-hydroxy-6-metoxy-1,4-benzoquinol methylase